MANLTSSKKDIRRIGRRTERNRMAKNRLKTMRKRFDVAVQAGQADKAKAELPALVAGLDKAAKNCTIHANKASRLKSRLAKRLRKLAAPPAAAQPSA